MLLRTSISRTLCCLGSAAALWACGSGRQEGREAPEARPYRLTGTVAQDSLHRDAPLTLYTDSHGRLQCDTLPVAGGRFSHSGRTADVDELYLYDAAGRAFRLYATGGQELEVRIDSAGCLHLPEADSLNAWLREAEAALDTTAADALQPTLDSLCLHSRSHVRAALLLRRYLPQLADSVGIRRTLGALAPQAKPAWLMQDIDDVLDRRSALLKAGGTATACKIQTRDTLVNLLDTHPNGYLMLFWADYAPLSLDSLSLMDRIARQYGLYGHEQDFLRRHKDRQPKRLELLTVCLHAADSAAWLAAVKDVPGLHAWMPAGLNDPRLRQWGVEQVPQVMLINQSGAVMATEWGAALREAIGRLPDRAQPKATPKPAPKQAAAADRNRAKARSQGTAPDRNAPEVRFKDVVNQ